MRATADELTEAAEAWRTDEYDPVGDVIASHRPESVDGYCPWTNIGFSSELNEPRMPAQRPTWCSTKTRSSAVKSGQAPRRVG
jgi:hypothetical protein